MHRINSSNKSRALEILVRSFSSNPGALWVVKKDKKIKERIAVLCEFCLNFSIHKDGAYISSDDKGVALLFESTKKVTPWIWLKSYVKLGTYCIGWTRAYAMIKRELIIQSKRPNKNHLYFWMLGIEDNSNGVSTIIEIRDAAFALSKKHQLPIYAETTLKQNRIVYERYGFKVYHTWNIPEEDIEMWFLKRDVQD